MRTPHWSPVHALPIGLSPAPQEDQGPCGQGGAWALLPGAGVGGGDGAAYFDQVSRKMSSRR